jgi:hypothetical protein
MPGVACFPGSKKPGAVSRAGSSRTFGEYALLEDSRYMSQEDSWLDLIDRKNFDSSVVYQCSQGGAPRRPGFTE